MSKNLSLPVKTSTFNMFVAGAAVALLTATAQMSMAQQNTAGNVSVPMNTSSGGASDQDVVEQPGTMIVAIYRGPGYFDESKVGTLGSGVKPADSSQSSSSTQTNDSDSELNPDYTPPPPAPPMDQRPSLPDPPSIDMSPEDKNGTTNSDELKVEEISMPSLPSSQEAPLPPPPSLESLSPPADPAPSSENAPPTIGIVAPTPPPVQPVQPVQQNEAKPASTSAPSDELPSLSLPPPPSLDSIPPFETE